MHRGAKSPKRQGGRRRAWITGRRGVCLVVCTALVSFGTAAVDMHNQAAASPPAPIPTCTADQAGCTPPDLLNDTELTTPQSSNTSNFYSATTAQVASLHALEQQAIANTLTDHHLPASDTAAVETWARSDALAELWLLIVQAIQATTPTTDQQNVVAWLTTVMQRRAQAEADDAAWEFLKWAGYLPGNQPIPTESTIVSDLNLLANGGTAQPLEYNTDPTTTTPTSGYCVWLPPAPFQSEYTGNTADQCGYPFRCTSLLGCNVPEPTYDQFVKYGDTDVENARADNTDSAYSGKGVASALEFLGAGLGAGIAGFALGGALPTAFGATVASSLLPYAGVDLGDFAIGATGAVDAEIAGAAGAAAVGAVVAIVILAVAIAVIEGILITQGLAIPGQLSQLIANAASSPPDLNTILTDSQQLTGLFGVFIGASLPSPSLQVCDNSILTVPRVGPGTTQPPCLNAPPIPAPANSDPQFVIAPKGSSPSIISDTLNWTDVVSSSSGVPTLASQDTARISGNWFVTHITDAVANPTPTTTTTPDEQSLSIDYTDWNGTDHTAWLVRQPDGSYKFLTAEDGVSVNPTTCVADGTCVYSDSIDYQEYDSLHTSTPTISDFTATITSVPTRVTVSQELGQTVLTEGSPAALDLSVSGGAPPFTEQWWFVTPRTNTLCTPSVACQWDGPFSGTQISYTPPAPGPLQGVVFVSDSGGRVYQKDFTLNAADVAPTLTLGATDVHTTDLGGTTTLTGAVVHAGSNDTEGVTIDWGDGSTVSGTDINGQLIIVTPGLNLSLSGNDVNLSGTHVYANAGPYTVTVSVGDGGGGSASTTTSETVNMVGSGTTLAASATSPVVGQPVTYTATVTASPATPKGTVTFSEGSTALCADVALSAAAPYTAICDHAYQAFGTHTVTAAYSGDTNYIGSTSGAVVITALAPPAFTADSPPSSATAGRSYAYTFAASALPGATFALASGALPPGLNLNPETGVLSGSPTTTGPFSFTVKASNGLAPDATSPPITIMVAPAPGEGYWLATADGSVFNFGDAASFGSQANPHPTAPVVAMVSTPDGKGYWLATSDGWVFNFGDAAYFGSMGDQPLNRPVVAMAATPDGKGYWLTTSDGGVFSFGDAAFYGSTGALHLNKPVVAMASTPDGKGYWMAASDGGVFSFGDAAFYGSTGAIHLNRPVVAMASTPDGQGYWMAASDGGVFSFGDAAFYGSTGAIHLNRPVTAMASTPDGQGYWMAASDGGVFNFGDAGFLGSEGGAHLNSPIVALR